LTGSGSGLLALIKEDTMLTWKQRVSLNKGLMSSGEFQLARSVDGVTFREFKQGTPVGTWKLEDDGVVRGPSGVKFRGERLVVDRRALPASVVPCALDSVIKDYKDGGDKDSKDSKDSKAV